MEKSVRKNSSTIFGALTLVVALCLAGLLLAGCSQKSSETAAADQPAQSTTLPHTFTDDLGNEVVVKSTDRVVACMGSFANTWELAGGTLVGATDDAFDDYGIASTDAARVGAFTAPNLEQIIALEPDYVIMTGSSTGKDGAASQTDLKQSLEASGIAVAYFNVTTFEDYLRMLRTCCDITGREDLYEQNGQAIADKIAAVKVSVKPDAPAPSVLLMTTYSGGTRVQNSSTMTGAMLADLGVKNLADENKSLLKDFSLESVIELNPDFIFVVPMGNDNAAAMKNLTEATEANPAWSTLTAVQNGNFITLDKKNFLYKPNALWADSYQVLYDSLYA